MSYFIEQKTNSNIFPVVLACAVVTAESQLDICCAVDFNHFVRAYHGSVLLCSQTAQTGRTPGEHLQQWTEFQSYCNVQRLLINIQPHISESEAVTG